MISQATNTTQIGKKMLTDRNGKEYRIENGAIVTTEDGATIHRGMPEGYQPIDVEALIDYVHAADLLLTRDRVEAVDRLAFESICDEPDARDIYDAAFNAEGMIHGIIHSYLPRSVVEARR